LNYQEHRLDASVIHEAMKNLLLVRQKEGESLQDYTKRFKTAREVLESHVGGTFVLPTMMKMTTPYVAGDDNQMKANERYLAFVYMDGADKAKHGSLMKNLHQQFSLKNNQFPTTVVMVTHVLSNHKFDEPDKSKHDRQNKDNKDKDKEKSKTEETKEAPQLSFIQMEGRCYCCGRPGHKSPQCCLKDTKPKEEWAMHKMKKEEGAVNMQAETQITEYQPPKNKKVTEAWVAAHVSQFLNVDMKRAILLDSQSSCDIFCNPQYVKNIHTVNEMLVLTTNAGALYTDKKADIPGYGTMWFDENAITNIFSLREISDQYKVGIDQVKNHLYVNVGDKRALFKRQMNNLYVYMLPTPKDLKQLTCTLNTMLPIDCVQENKKFYTARQVERAKKARQVYHA
jgi:hypothetical protein